MQVLNAAPVFPKVRFMPTAIDNVLKEASIAKCYSGFINKIV